MTKTYWQELLGLNDLLSKLSSIDAIIETLTENVNHLLRCQTEVILTDSVFSFGSQSIGSSITQDVESSTQPNQEFLNPFQVNRDSTTISVTLIVRSTALGIIHCQRSDQPFSDAEIMLIRAIANDVSMIIDNYRLNRSVQQQTTRLSTLAEISNAITSTLDVDILLNSVASLIQKSLNYPYVYVFTVHRWQKTIQLRAGGMTNYKNESDVDFYDLNDQGGLLAQAIEKRQTILSRDITVNHPLSQLPPTEALSELIVPLIFGDQVLGILYLRSEHEDTFTQSDVFLLEMLSDYVAIALRNGNLYKSEQWRRKVADSLRDVAGLLSTEVSLDHLLSQLLEELTRILPGETAAIWLFENIETDNDSEQFTSPLSLAALRSPNIEISDLTEQLNISKSEEWLGYVIENRYPVIHDIDALDDPFGKYFGYTEHYSAVIASLWVDLRPIGILILAHPQPGRYGSEAQSILSAFGSYAAVAIKNAQQYKAAHDQAWVSTVLLQVAEATQSINNLDDLVHTIVRIIPQLIGVDACAILSWDKMVEEFSPHAAFGLTLEQQDYFDHWYIRKGQLSAFDHILSSGEPVIFNQTLGQQGEVSNIFNLFDLANKIFVIFPMISQTEIQGAILVDYSDINSETNIDLWGEKFSIIQGIAHQTAVAIENIRLIRAQEEEAYVSIALLQVAQAIVSAKEIKDVLGVVVRITPMLVAMRRCSIYLWDFLQDVFIISQSFGISKSELATAPQQFKPSSFPLLELVRQSGHIVCHMIDNDAFCYSDWIDLDEEDFQIINPADGNIGDIYTTTAKDVLGSKTGLLLAYPLAIKGTVLGVMVTEEELADRGTPSYQIRERRMEIVTGITQQTALALQNDILQREAIQRERLERELQLAKEIQSNFMPEEMPKLKGWNLGVSWKPARQVGGDYYDVFELPDGNIGIVIADVADKGMPAALFMTLVRTLLRATVRDNVSPATALYEVNELLLPDAKNGMFVTLFYGILNPDNGNFTYSNAGHVPPLLVPKDKACLVELMPSAMALGVMSSINIEEHLVQIFPGDSLVFYTDGVSEAFSPTGEMYGTDRLRQLILGSGASSATHLLELIINSVSEFTASAPVADDLTLIALHREHVT